MNNISLMDFDTLVEAVKGKTVASLLCKKSCTFTSVVTDSRKVEKGSLFVPLIGEFQDGHKYISQAVENGASVVFVGKKYYRTHKDEINISAGRNKVCFVIVNDTLTALQKAAEFYVKKFPKLIKIGITGSSGKTTTKEIAVALLSKKYNVVANEGNLNSETGLPLSVFRIKPEHEVGIFEMGMNRKNEIGEIAKVLKPQYAVITNIGTAHIGLLGSTHNIAKEKKKIFSYIDKTGVAVLPKNDKYSQFLSQGLPCKIRYFGSDIQESENGIKFLKSDGINGSVFSVDGIETKLALPGNYNYVNALAAIELARTFYMSTEQIVSGIASIKPVSGRTEIFTMNIDGKSVTIIQDCYNANPDSMCKALDFISSIESSGRKFCILGDMLELGTQSEQLHIDIGKKILESEINYIVFIGTDMKYAFDIAAEYHQKFYDLKYFSDSTEESIGRIADYIISTVQNGDVVLLKGSRGLKLERILTIFNETKQERNKNE